MPAYCIFKKRKVVPHDRNPPNFNTFWLFEIPVTYFLPKVPFPIGIQMRTAKIPCLRQKFHWGQNDRDVNGTDIFRSYLNSIRSENGFYPSVSGSEYPISVTDLYSNAQNLYFYDVDIHYNLIRQKTNTIRIRLCIRTQI